MSTLLAGAQGSTINNPVLNGMFQGLVSSPTGGGTFLSLVVPKLITMTLVVGSVIFFFMLTIGAIQWIASGGDKGAIESARGKITNALIGIIILFSVYAIIRFIEVFFGITLLTLDIGTLVIQ